MKTPEEIKKGLECCFKGGNCGVCPYNVDVFSDDCMEELSRDHKAYIEQLEAQVPKWISVDNPPQKEGEYIVTVQTTDGKKERLWDIFQPNHEWCEDGEGNKVLFWMSFDSLPEPPKED